MSASQGQMSPSLYDRDFYVWSQEMARATREHRSTDFDIENVAEPVLTHRIITTFAAQAQGIGAKQIVRRLVQETEKSA